MSISVIPKTAQISKVAHFVSSNMGLVAANRRETVLNRTPKKAASFTLMALTLAACKGGSGENGGQTNFGGVPGNLLKGPVEGAFVFADYNEDGAWDEGQEPFARTDSNGAYQLEGVDTQQSYELVALLNGAVDNSSGNVFSSGSMVAPVGSKVITPFTTIMVEQELTSEQVANVLGLSDLQGFDPLTFNPYEEGVDAPTALAVEKTAHKVMAVVQSLSAIYEQLGEDSDTAFAMAIDVVADEVKSKANNEETLLLGGDQSSVASLIDDAILRAQSDGHNTATVSGLKTSITAAVNNSIAQIEKVTVLSDDGEPNAEFQIIATLVSQIAEAVADNDDTKITLKDENVAEAKIEELQNNTAPEITLENVQETISEAATNLVVAVVAATDIDQGDQITITLRGPDAEFFEVTDGNEIVFIKQPNYEEKTNYDIIVVASDGKEQAVKFLAVSITDKEPLALLTINIPKLNGLDATIDTDLTAAEQAINGFYGSGETRLVNEIETFLTEFEAGDIDVSSTGIVLTGSTTGQQIALSFANFSPNSLESLISTIEKFEATQDFDDLTISGGFSSFSISNSGDKLVELAHTSNGIEWRNPNAKQGDVDTFVIEGTFGNQIGDYIDILAVAQNDFESSKSEIDLLFNAYDALNRQIEFKGISAKSDGKTIFRIGDNDIPNDETLEVFVAGSVGGDHELTLSIGGATDFANGIVEAAGGFDNFLRIADALFGVEAYTYSNELSYNLYTYITASEEYSFTSGIFNYAEEDLLGSDGTFIDLSLVEFNTPLQFETSSGKQLTEQEYVELKGIIEDVQGYLGGVDQPIDILNFGLKYEYGSDVVAAADVTGIVSLGEALSFFDNKIDFVFAGYNENDVAVTEISDTQENFALKLIGVEKSDFIEKYQGHGSDIQQTIDLYVAESNVDILSGVTL